MRSCWAGRPSRTSAASGRSRPTMPPASPTSWTSWTSTWCYARWAPRKDRHDQRRRRTGPGQGPLRRRPHRRRRPVGRVRTADRPGTAPRDRTERLGARLLGGGPGSADRDRPDLRHRDVPRERRRPLRDAHPRDRPRPRPHDRLAAGAVRLRRQLGIGRLDLALRPRERGRGHPRDPHLRLERRAGAAARRVRVASVPAELPRRLPRRARAGGDLRAASHLIRQPLGSARRVRRAASSGNTSTVSAPPVTITEAVVTEIRPEVEAIWVTATMIGSPVAAYRPSATFSRRVSSPDPVEVHSSRAITGRPRTAAIIATNP